MPEVIHITLQYSNAVLVALLPYFSDFAEKLDLPVPAPITTNDVARFAPRNLPGDVGGTVFLTSGWIFRFYRGHVEGFQAPDNYLSLQDPGRIHEFVGTVNLDTNQAIQLARATLNRMGYAEKLPETTNAPYIVDGPEEWQRHMLPYYRIEWRWDTDTRASEDVVAFDIDADRGLVKKFHAVSMLLWGEPPTIDIVPELRPRFQNPRCGLQQADPTGAVPRRRLPP